MNSKVEGYLSQKKQTSSPQLADKFDKIEELFTKKLWHQLTLALMSLVQEPEMRQGTELITLYNSLICEVENKINPLSLATMGGEVMTQFSDPREAVTFMERIIPKVTEHQEARVLANVLIAQVTLTRLEDQAKTKKILEEADELLDEIDGVTPVHAKFFLLASDLYCRTGAHSDYYRAALRYLGCTDLADMDSDTKARQAFYLGLAALLGDGIYNFGELLAHPILEALTGTPSEWLKDLLVAFNAGDLGRFESMRSKWMTQPDLVAKENRLREKIRLLCLMEMTFQRKAWERQLTFAEIGAETGLPKGQVEVMVMRALSLGLLRGTIDQVEEKVNISWVQPRVLDKTQLACMMDRLNDWCKDVSSMQHLLQDQASSILTL